MLKCMQNINWIWGSLPNWLYLILVEPTPSLFHDFLIKKVKPLHLLWTFIFLEYRLLNYKKTYFSQSDKCVCTMCNWTVHSVHNKKDFILFWLSNKTSHITITTTLCYPVTNTNKMLLDDLTKTDVGCCSLTQKSHNWNK
jgi:hypothetical protein